MHTQFVQLGGPHQLFGVAFVLFVGFGNLAKQVVGHQAHACGLRHVHRKPAAEPLHGALAHVRHVGFAVDQVVQRPVAQRALGGLHVVDAKQVKHRTQHADAPADDQLAVVFDAFKAQVVHGLRTQQAFLQPVQAFTADGVAVAPIGGQHIGNGPHRARRAVGHVPLVAGEHVECFVQHRLRGNFGGFERHGCERVVGEITRRPGHTAQAERVHGLGPKALAHDDFGGAPANVHHQAALVRLGQQARHALVNQPRFFQPRNDFDGEAQYLLCFLYEHIAVARLAQRLGGHGTHLRFVKTLDALGKAGQAVPTALHGHVAQVAVFAQATTLAHPFLEVFHAVDVAVVKAADFEPETVGAQVNGRE